MVAYPSPLSGAVLEGFALAEGSSSSSTWQRGPL
jgi:hypothetical protein